MFLLHRTIRKVPRPGRIRTTLIGRFWKTRWPGRSVERVDTIRLHSSNSNGTLRHFIITIRRRAIPPPRTGRSVWSDRASSDLVGGRVSNLEGLHPGSAFNHFRQGLQDVRTLPRLSASASSFLSQRLKAVASFRSGPTKVIASSNPFSLRSKVMIYP